MLKEPWKTAYDWTTLDSTAKKLWKTPSRNPMTIYDDSAALISSYFSAFYIVSFNQKGVVGKAAGRHARVMYKYQNQMPIVVSN